jgi:hypothetical protein
MNLNSLSFDVELSQAHNGTATKLSLHLLNTPADDNDLNNIGENGVHYRRSKPPSRSASVLESKSPGFINTRLVNYNRGLSYQPSFKSQSQYHSEIENIPPPSTDEEKGKTTK